MPMRRERDVLMPQPPGGLAPGALLALLVHGGLIVALTLSVDWRMKTPEPVSAELWAALPQVAAPAPPPAPMPAPPPPPPAPAPPPPAAPPAPAAPAPDAQIAIERAEKRRVENERKAEAEKTAKAAAEKKRQEQAERQREAAERRRNAEAQKAEEQRLARQREEQLQRMLGSLPAATPATTAATGTAARDAAPSQDYMNRLAQAFRRNLTFGGQIDGDPVAEVEVSATPSGTIIGRRLVKSTGNKALDDAVLRAIDATGTLPRDPSVRLPPTFTVAFRPNE